MTDEPRPIVKRRRLLGNRIEPPPRRSPDWQRNWVDYRASLARVWRRVETGDRAPECGVCHCEADVTPVPHSPRCTQADA